MSIDGYVSSRRGRGLVLSLLLAAGVLCLPAARAAEKPVNFKLGTLAPNGSSYHQNLQAMGEHWRTASGGKVKLTIFAGGTQGSEADMVGLMQTGSLDAGLLTAMGLGDIEPEVNALQSMPMAFRSLAEVDYVGEKLRPMLEKRLLAKGYQVLFWTDTGWVRFFAKSPVLYPADLKKLKIVVWAGATEEFDTWKAAGFSPVALETKDITQGLFSGTVSAVCVPPVFALFSQLDSQAKHMLELNWGPLVGAAVVRKKSWDRLSPDVQEKLLKIANDAGAKVRAAGRAEADSAVAAMVKRGLTVTKVTPDAEAQWREEVAKIEGRIRGHVVPADMYDEAQRLLKEYRAGAGAKAK